MLFLANMSEGNDPQGGTHYDKLKSHFGENHVVPVAVGMESELNELEEEDRQLF